MGPKNCVLEGGRDPYIYGALLRGFCGSFFAAAAMRSHAAITVATCYASGQRSVRRVLADSSVKTEQLSCLTVADYVRANRKSSCVVVDPHTSLHPRDIWELDDSFGRLARTVFYGAPAIRRPEPRYDDQLVPNIAHLTWLGGGPMDFLFYLCVASLIYVARVEAVYIHGDGPPTGPYWQLIKDHPKLHLIYRQHPSTVRTAVFCSVAVWLDLIS